ncbi:sigma-70 family RNA polymerase sigma factor [Silvibacterium dinghuense]|uniref:Sigma-70 family RNA polymerase sigma factor n=1 Tax=Silvibacterium dinghuense TaxID=1560006 RepID=A0A4Q1S8X8_9BACT|nr:sigma-70 family RNA polymerase sigma factor [Silvibacterium dinghuense]RXS93457.1 sigma-70 family RNA polymerase sigma factor [Silvibacterium dinghuense]GGH05995.1 RNA polymerase sigma factor [Silvibacterium dinghuense]
MQVGIAVGNLASAIGVRQEESAIVAQLQAGSEEAFAWLISTYHQPVYSLLARTIPLSADAADLTQEVFVKIYRGISGFHGDASLKTWIYRIALHEASNQRRWWSRHRRQEVTIEAETGESNDGQALCIKDTLMDPGESPFECAERSEMRARVEAILREVPEPFRTVVVLRDLEGFAYEEIAEILNVNLGTVKSRLLRGRANLKARLAPLAESVRKRPAAVGRAGVLAASFTAEEAR